MILSTSFSRQNKAQHSWTNGTASHSANGDAHHYLGGSLRRPAPQQPAPDRPIDGATNGYRSHTLNRLDLLKRRQQQQQQQQQARNLSSLGHYPTSNQQQAKLAAGGSTSNGYGASHQNRQNLAPSQIYAPASIASPSEFAYYNRPAAQHKRTLNGESQHYAATSCLAPPSESGRSGRESALGNLIERFGTLRRRARWSKSSSRKSTSNSSPSSHGGCSTQVSDNDNIPLRQPNSLEPEIYASGKKRLEADEIYAEGLRAIDGNALRRSLEHELDSSIMNEGETRTLIDEKSKRQVEFMKLVLALTNWINDELAEQRIIVTDLQDDLYDGQILCKLIEKLHNIKLDIIEVTQNEMTQKYKLRTVLDTINRILTLQARWARIRWTVEGIHSKNMVEIIHLLVTLALFYRAPIKIPPNVMVNVLVVQKYQGQLVRRSHQAQLTDKLVSTLDFGPTQQQLQQRDAFDTMMEIAPEKLEIVKQSLVRFVNRHLNKINMSCFQNQLNGTILDPDQFSDGLLLVFLISSLEDYFVPLGNLFTGSASSRQQQQQPTLSLALDQADKLPFIDGNNNDHDDNLTANGKPLQTALEPTNYINAQPIHKLHNVNVAFQLMEEAGVEIRQRVRAEDVVNGDLKAVLRVLYALFSRYKHV